MAETSPAERHPIDEVTRAAGAAGSRFFDLEATRFFGTRYGGSCWAPPSGPWLRFFATSEKPPHGPRVFVVRVARYRDPAKMEGFTIDTLAGLPPAGPGPRDMEGAERICRALAAGSATAPSARGSILEAWEAATANLRRILAPAGTVA